MSPAASRAVVIAAIAALGAGALLAGCAAVSSSEPHAAAATRAPEAEWFVKTGCTACHSISVYDIRSVAATGPDLSVAAEDVPRRFGRSLDDFSAPRPARWPWCSRAEFLSTTSNEPLPPASSGTPTDVTGS